MTSSAVAWWALQLAKTPEAWAALLAGEAVEPSAIRPDWLERARALKLVRLDRLAIDELYYPHGLAVALAGRREAA